MKVTTPPGRLLWNHPATVGLCGLSLLDTASIIALQIARRAGVYDPEWVQIFDRLFLFDDFAAAWLFLASLLVAMIPAVQRVGSELARWVGDHPEENFIKAGGIRNVSWFEWGDRSIFNKVRPITSRKI